MRKPSTLHGARTPILGGPPGWSTGWETEPRGGSEPLQVPGTLFVVPLDDLGDPVNWPRSATFRPLIWISEQMDTAPSAGHRFFWADRDVSNKHRHTSIADNPSAQKISDYLLLAKIVRLMTGFSKTLGITNATVDRFHQGADKALRQSDILTLPDRFNDAFACEGWIATGSMSADTMRKAVELYESGKKQEAEEEILAWFQEDTINQLAITRGKRFHESATRWHQLREALKLTLEERYWSAVPLILVACDGFALDVLGTSPFAKDADLTAFDSIAGHPNSLQFLIKKLTKGVRKSSDEDLTLPLRHGILHGHSLGYANRIVCMKAWLLMIALVDWACDKTSENARRRAQQSEADVSFRDIAGRLREVDENKRAMNAFEPLDTIGPFNDRLDEDSAEFAIIKFLTHWKCLTSPSSTTRAGRPRSSRAWTPRGAG